MVSKKERNKIYLFIILCICAGFRGRGGQSEVARIMYKLSKLASHPQKRSPEYAAILCTRSYGCYSGLIIIIIYVHQNKKRTLFIKSCNGQTSQILKKTTKITL